MNRRKCMCYGRFLSNNGGRLGESEGCQCYNQNRTALVRELLNNKSQVVGQL